MNSSGAGRSSAASLDHRRQVLRGVSCGALALLVCSARGIQVESERVLFEQPRLVGVEGNFHVPPAEHRYPVDKAFELLIWQANPNQPDGRLVPTAWAAGEKTGFFPSAPLLVHQWGFKDAGPTTTVQIEGGTVGAYINSSDLPENPDMGKLMITPAWKPAVKDRMYPFAQVGQALVDTLDLQIPTAKSQNRPGSYAYAVENLVFEDRTTKTTISYGFAIFHHDAASGKQPSVDRLRATEVGKFDGPSHSFQVGNPVLPGSRVLTVLEGSSLYQTQPWTGFRSYRVAITKANFAQGLQSLATQGPGFRGSANPADWALVEVHLNAEVQFATAPAELGWSMRSERVTLEPESQLRRMQ